MRGDESINQHSTGTKECLSKYIKKAKHNLKNNICTLQKKTRLYTLLIDYFRTTK
jgi:hypothetical protein